MENKILVIGVSGKKGSGKDLFFTYAKAKVGAKRVAFADYLKHITRQFFNLSVEQTDGNAKEQPTKFTRDGKALTPRQIMIELGQFFRSIDPGFWYKKAFEVIKGFNQGTVVVITDVRFKNEAEYVKEQGGFMVRLQRSQAERDKVYPGGKFNDDPSEIDLDDYEGFSYTIPENKNQNPQQLQQQVEKILDDIFKKINTKS